MRNLGLKIPDSSSYYLKQQVGGFFVFLYNKANFNKKHFRFLCIKCVN